MTRERTVSGSRESERPVRTDVFIHNLDTFTLEALRRAVAQGLQPFDLDFVENGIVILRLARLRAGGSPSRG